MSALEATHRGRSLARHVVDAATWEVSERAWRARWEPAPASILAGVPATEPVGFLTSDRAAFVAREEPLEARRTVDRGRSLLAGEYQFLGYPPVSLTRPIQFATDPSSGFRWPDRHAKALDYRRSSAGDPKWAWELNRLQHLTILVAAWLLSGEEEFAREAVDQARTWMDQSPPGRGIAWSNGFEAGLRAVSLCLVLDALRGSAILGDDDRTAFLRALWQHARWIEIDPSLHSSANNHRIGELVGLVAIAVLAPELRGAASLRRRAVDELAREADLQIAPDGTSREQAMAYHVFVVDLLLLAAAILEAAGLRVPEELRSVLRRSADALTALAPPGEPVPTFGDDDGGHAVRLDGRPVREARGVAASLAAYLGHPGARLVAQTTDVAAAWLFGASGVARFSTTAPAEPPPSLYLPDAGLAVLRHGPSRTLVDVGPLGYLSLAAHGHADALQMTFAHEGQELISDPGTGSYFARPRWRRAFRGTAFHATVVVDGLDQSESGGPFLWSRHARIVARHVSVERGFVIGEHDGYQRLPDPVRHVRAVFVRPTGEVLIVDRLTAEGAHSYSQRWPFHPSVWVDADGDRMLSGSILGRRRLRVEFASSVPTELSLARASEDPFTGWWSNRLESAEPAWLASLHCVAAGTVYLASVVRPFADDSGAHVHGLRLEVDHGVAWLEYATPLGAVRVSVDFDAPAVSELAPPGLE